MKKRKELLIFVFLASVCIHIILFLLNAIQLWPYVEKTVTNTVSSMWGKIAWTFLVNLGGNSSAQ
jgi:hypothetical protein